MVLVCITMSLIQVNIVNESSKSFTEKRFPLNFIYYRNKYIILNKICFTAEEPLQGPGIAKGGDVWALVIKSVKASDAGLYMCELNTEPPVRSVHRLTGK